LTAWTTGEPNAPPDVAAVYRAVLDEIFPRGQNGPSLVVINEMTEPSLVEIDTTAKRPHRRPDAAIAPFGYRIPITFVDTASLRDLWKKSREADSIAQTVPMTDLRSRQQGAAPFIERYPGAWGRVTFGRVGFDRRFAYALVEVRFLSVVPGLNYGQERVRLVRTGNEWKVVERIPHFEAIKAEAIPYGMLHAWIDSSSLPTPKRRLVRGTVRDSASGVPLRSFAIRIEAVPVDKHGRMMQGRFPEPSGTVFTDSAGAFVISHPPSGDAVFHAECPPSRDIGGAELGYVVLQAESGLDTVLNFHVRFASCAELAPAMAKAAERHRQDVARAKVEAAARAVQGNIWGTLRDSRTGRPVPRAPMRVDERGGIGASDSLGHFWLWGFAPGTRKIIVYCPLRRQWLGKIATTLTIQAPPAMKDTTDIRIDMQGCDDVQLDTVSVHTRGVWSIGFEDGFFTPCEPFDQIELGGYRDWSHLAYLTFARSGITPPGGWPEMKPTDGYYKIFLVVDADLIGPGSYGHLGIATYTLKVTGVVSAKPASKTSCVRPDIKPSQD